MVVEDLLPLSVFTRWNKQTRPRQANVTQFIKPSGPIVDETRKHRLSSFHGCLMKICTIYTIATETNRYMLTHITHIVSILPTHTTLLQVSKDLFGGLTY